MPSDPVADDRSSTSTSRSLLARLHTNDATAWDRLLTLYAPLVWHWCRTMNLPEQDVADVFQEVFQSVATNIGKFRKSAPGDTFRGWLRTITRNKVLDHFRRMQHEPQGAGGTEARLRLAQVPDGPGPNETPQENRLWQELYQRALQLIQTEFEPRTWMAFWRVVVGGQSAPEVAAELAMTPGAVRVAKCRVLHRLRQELGDVHV